VIEKIKNIFQHQGFKKYFLNTSWLFAEKIFRMIVGLVVGIWVARYLGPSKYGVLSYAQSFVGLFSAIATLGLDGIVVRELVKYPEKEKELLGTAFILKLFGAVLTLIVIYIAIHFTSNDVYTNRLIFIIASAVIFQSFNVIDMYFQAKVMSKYAVFANSFSLLLSSFVKIMLIINDAPLIAFAWAVLFDSFVMVSGYIYWYFKVKKEFFLRKIKFNLELAKSLLKDSWPLILSGMVIAMYMRIDQVMIKEMLDNKAVGNYAAAVRLSEAWYFIPMVISSSLFPAIINAKKQSEELYYARLQRLYDLMVWLAIAIALPMTFLSDWVVNLLYGSQYSEAGSVLKIHIWAGLFVALGLVRGRWIISENLQKYTPIYLVTGLIVNIVLNYYFIQIYGIKGAAYATLFAQSAGSLIASSFFKKTRISFMMMINSMFIIPSIIRILKNNNKDIKK